MRRGEKENKSMIEESLEFYVFFEDGEDKIQVEEMEFIDIKREGRVL